MVDWLTCPKARRKNDYEQVITVMPGRGELVVEIFELTAAKIATRLDVAVSTPSGNLPGGRAALEQVAA